MNEREYALFLDIEEDLKKIEKQLEKQNELLSKFIMELGINEV